MATYVQKWGNVPGREPPPSSQVLRYGDFTARGNDGGLAGVYCA